MAGKKYTVPFFGTMDEDELQGLQMLLYWIGYEDVMPTGQIDEPTTKAIKDVEKETGKLRELWSATFPNRPFPKDFEKELSTSEVVLNWFKNLPTFNKVITVLGDWGNIGRDIAVARKKYWEEAFKDPEQEEKALYLALKEARGGILTPEEKKWIETNINQKAKAWVASGQATRQMNPVLQDLTFGYIFDTPFDILDMAILFATGDRLKTIRPTVWGLSFIPPLVKRAGSYITGKAMEAGQGFTSWLVKMFSRPSTATAVEFAQKTNSQIRSYLYHIKDVVPTNVETYMDEVVNPIVRKLVDAKKAISASINDARHAAEAVVEKYFKGLSDEEVLWIDGALTDPAKAGKAPSARAEAVRSELERMFEILSAGVDPAMRREFYAPQPIISEEAYAGMPKSLLNFKEPFYLKPKTLGTYSRSREEVIARYAYRIAAPEIAKHNNELIKIAQQASEDMLREIVEKLDAKTAEELSNRFWSMMERVQIPGQTKQNLWQNVNNMILKPATNGIKSMILTRPGYFARNAYSAVERVVTEFFSDLSQGKLFSPVFFKVAPKDVVGTGLYGMQKPQTNKVFAWLYDHLGQSVEDFFRSGIYKGKYNQYMADLAAGKLDDSMILNRLAKIFSIPAQAWKDISLEVKSVLEDYAAAGITKGLSTDEFNALVDDVVEEVLNSHYIPSEYTKYVKYFAGVRNAPIDFSKIAHDLAADEVDRIMCNYSDYIGLQVELRGVAPFIQWKKNNIGYWLQTWARMPWLLNVEFDHYKERQPLVIDAFAELFGVDKQEIQWVNVMTTADLFRPFAPYMPGWVVEREKELKLANQEYEKYLKEDKAKAEKFLAQRPELQEYRRILETNAIRKAISWVFETLQVMPTITIPTQLLGLVEKQDWRSLTPYADVIFKTTGIDIEFFMGRTAHEAKMKAWENDINREMRLMAFRGEAPDRKEAEKRVRLRGLYESIWGFGLGLYGKSVAEQEVKMQALLNAAYPFTKLKVEPAKEDVLALKQKFGLTDAQANFIAKRKAYPARSLAEQTFLTAVLKQYPELGATLDVKLGTEEDIKLQEEFDKNEKEWRRLFIQDPRAASAYAESHPMWLAYISTKSYRDTWDMFTPEEIDSLMVKDSGYQKTVDALAARIQKSNKTIPESAARNIAQEIVNVATYKGLDPVYLAAVIEKESNYNMAARPPAGQDKGEIGLMQLRPTALKEIERVSGLKINPYSVHENILGGATYLSHILNTQAGKDPRRAYAIYNGGVRGDEMKQPLANADAVMGIYNSINQEVASKLPAAPLSKELPSVGKQQVPAPIATPGQIFPQVASGVESIPSTVVTDTRKFQGLIISGDYSKEDVIAARKYYARMGYDVSTTGDPGVIDEKLSTVITSVILNGIPRTAPFEATKAYEEQLKTQGVNFTGAILDTAIAKAEDWLWEAGWSPANLDQLGKTVYEALRNKTVGGRLVYREMMDNAQIRDAVLWVQERFRREGQKAQIYTEILRRAEDPNDPQQGIFQRVKDALLGYKTHSQYLLNPIELQRLRDREEQELKDKTVQDILRVGLGADRWTGPMIRSVIQAYGMENVQRAAEVNGKLKVGLRQYNSLIEFEDKTYRVIDLADKYDATLEHYRQRLSATNREISGETITQVFDDMKQRDPLMFHFFFEKYDDYYVTKQLYDDGRLAKYEEDIKTRQLESRLGQYFTALGYTSAAFDLMIKDMGAKEAHEALTQVGLINPIIRVRYQEYQDPSENGMRAKELKDKNYKRALELATEIRAYGLSKEIYSKIEQETPEIRDELIKISEPYRFAKSLGADRLIQAYFRWGDVAKQLSINLNNPTYIGKTKTQIIEDALSPLSEEERQEFLDLYPRLYDYQGPIIAAYQTGRLAQLEEEDKKQAASSRVKQYIEANGGYSVKAWDETLKGLTRELGTREKAITLIETAGSPGGDPVIEARWLQYSSGEMAKLEAKEAINKEAQDLSDLINVQGKISKEKWDEIEGKSEELKSLLAVKNTTYRGLVQLKQNGLLDSYWRFEKTAELLERSLEQSFSDGEKLVALRNTIDRIPDTKDQMDFLYFFGMTRPSYRRYSSIFSVDKLAREVAVEKLKALHQEWRDNDLSTDYYNKVIRPAIDKLGVDGAKALWADDRLVGFRGDIQNIVKRDYAKLKEDVNLNIVAPWRKVNWSYKYYVEKIKPTLEKNPDWRNVLYHNPEFWEAVYEIDLCEKDDTKKIKEIQEGSYEQVIRFLDVNKWTAANFEVLEKGIFAEKPEVLDAWLQDTKFAAWWRRYKDTGPTGLRAMEKNEELNRIAQDFVDSLINDFVTPEQMNQFNQLVNQYGEEFKYIAFQKSTKLYSAYRRPSRYLELYSKVYIDGKEITGGQRLEEWYRNVYLMIMRKSPEERAAVGETTRTPFEKLAEDPELFELATLQYNDLSSEDFSSEVGIRLHAFILGDDKYNTAIDALEGFEKLYGKWRDDNSELRKNLPKWIGDTVAQFNAPFRELFWTKSVEELEQTKKNKELDAQLEEIYSIARSNKYPTATLDEWLSWPPEKRLRLEKLHPDVNGLLNEYQKDKDFQRAIEVWDNDVVRAAWAKAIDDGNMINLKIYNFEGLTPDDFDPNAQRTYKVFDALKRVPNGELLLHWLIRTYPNTIGVSYVRYQTGELQKTEDTLAIVQKHKLRWQNDYNQEYSTAFIDSIPPEDLPVLLSKESPWEGFKSAFAEKDKIRNKELERAAEPYMRKFTAKASRGELTAEDLYSVPENIRGWLLPNNTTFSDWWNMAHYYDKSIRDPDHPSMQITLLKKNQLQLKEQPDLNYFSGRIKIEGYSPAIFKELEEKNPALGDLLAEAQPTTFGINWWHWQTDKQQYTKYWYADLAAQKVIYQFDAAGGARNATAFRYLANPSSVVGKEYEQYGVTNRDIQTAIVSMAPDRFAPLFMQFGIVPMIRQIKPQQDAAAYKQTTGGTPISQERVIPPTTPETLPQEKITMEYAPGIPVVNPSQGTVAPTVPLPQPLEAEIPTAGMVGPQFTYPTVQFEEVPVGGPEAVQNMRWAMAQKAVELVAKTVEVSQRPGPNVAAYMAIAQEAASVGLLNFLPAAVSQFLIGPQFAILTTVVSIFEGLERRRQEEEARRKQEELRKQQELEQRRLLIQEAIQRGVDESYWQGLSQEQIKLLSQGHERIFERYQQRPSYANRIGIISALQGEVTRLNW